MVPERLERIGDLTRQLARARSELSAELPQGLLPLLGARVSQQKVAFCLEGVERVVGMARLLPLENAEPSVLGLLQLGSERIPVLSLARLLHLRETSFDRATAIVVLSDGGQRRGVVVDEVEGLTEAAAETLAPPDPLLPDLLWGTFPDGSWLVNHQNL